MQLDTIETSAFINKRRYLWWKLRNIYDECWASIDRNDGRKQGKPNVNGSWSNGSGFIIKASD